MTNILVIEDDAQIQRLIGELLQTDFSVYQAYSGTEGQLLFAQQTIDLVLLDLMLPGLSGEEVLEWLRQRSKIPVIIISAKDDLSEKVALLQAGADDYLVKPFDLFELSARIQVQLRHASQTKAQEDQLSYKEITVNQETREVIVNDSVLQLTVREFEILVLFLMYPKKVFSRSNLYETIWKEPYAAGEKTINVHISNLRSKLSSAGADYIKTVWGVGFKFD